MAFCGLNFPFSRVCCCNGKQNSLAIFLLHKYFPIVRLQIAQLWGAHQSKCRRMPFCVCFLGRTICLPTVAILNFGQCSGKRNSARATKSRRHRLFPRTHPIPTRTGPIPNSNWHSLSATAQQTHSPSHNAANGQVDYCGHYCTCCILNT